jgi:hypothetical protein
MNPPPPWTDNRAMTVRIFAWSPYRFHCYGIPDLGEGAVIYIADIFPAWMVPGLAIHEWVELKSGSHRLAVLAELLVYNLLWPLYHAAYLAIVHRNPLSTKLFG